MAAWMMHYHKENPFNTAFDKILDICRKYDVSLSLGSSFFKYAVNYTYGRYQLVGRRKYIHIPNMRGTSFMNDGAYSPHRIAFVSG